MAAANDRAALRLYRVLFALFALALAARVTYTIDAIRDMRHQYPAPPVTLGDPWPSIVSLRDSARAAGLQLGDRVIAIDGRPQDGMRRSFPRPAEQAPRRRAWFFPSTVRANA
jgi:hypothetical protein